MQISLGPIDLSCAFVISDLRLYDSPIVYVSPQFTVMTGFEPNEIIGRNCRFMQRMPFYIEFVDPTQEVFPGVIRSYTDHLVVSHIKKCVMERSEGQFTLVNYKKTGEV